ncbi:MAG TPA: 5-formyltetrahydrofolate cyclo-ligase [Alphaproteobacteria bacterium]|nr:5-formyltetrahydrofolate cyclo-ligase [Alphaproteobacteria bacterium]
MVNFFDWVINTPSKLELRRKYRDLTAKLTPYQRKIKSREICRSIFANFKLPKNSIIAGYIPFKNEVDISLLMSLYHESGYRLCLPVIENKDFPLAFWEYAPGMELKKNKHYGFFEPKIPAEVLPDMVITPLVAFDAACNRLGQGAGFYDRTLNHLSGFKDFIAIAPAFSIQQTAYIKVEKFDYTLDAIITEKRIFIAEERLLG